MKRIRELIQLLGFKTGGNLKDLSLMDHFLLKLGDDKIDEEVSCKLMEEIFGEDVRKVIFTNSKTNYSKPFLKDSHSSYLLELMNECKRSSISFNTSLMLLIDDSREKKESLKLEKDERYEALIKINRKFVEILGSFSSPFMKMSKQNDLQRFFKMLEKISYILNLGNLPDELAYTLKVANTFKEFMLDITLRLPIMIRKFKVEFDWMLNKGGSLISNPDYLMTLALLKKQLENYKICIEEKKRFLENVKDCEIFSSNNSEFASFTLMNTIVINFLNNLIKR